MKEKLVDFINLSREYKISNKSINELFKKTIEFNKKNNLNLSDDNLIEIMRNVIVSLDYIDLDNEYLIKSNTYGKNKNIISIFVEELNKIQQDGTISNEDLIKKMRYLLMKYNNESIEIKNVDELIEKSANIVLNDNNGKAK